MINRELIRIKIVQLTYAYYQNGNKNIDTAEKELFFSLSKAYDLYNHLLALIVAITKEARRRLEVLQAKAKREGTPEPSQKFAYNRFALQLEENKQLSEFVETQKHTWADDLEVVGKLLEQIEQSQIYKDYMNGEDDYEENYNNEEYYDDEVELDELLESAFKAGKRILICIDDIAKTEDMVAFCSVYAKLIRTDKPVYLVCTGLFSNMESLGRVKNLTFFKRAETIEVRSLSEVLMTTKYRKLLNLSYETARELSKMTRGYAYAYQVLGSLYFKKSKDAGIEDLIGDYEERLFSQSYEKIWEELTEGERNLVEILIEYKKREDILQHMSKPGNYSEYRNSLLRGGLIREVRRGEVEFSLPRFEEYVRIFKL